MKYPTYQNYNVNCAPPDLPHALLFSGLANLLLRIVDLHFWGYIGTLLSRISTPHIGCPEWGLFQTSSAIGIIEFLRRPSPRYPSCGFLREGVFYMFLDSFLNLNIAILFAIFSLVRFCKHSINPIMLVNTQTAAWLEQPRHGATLTLRNDIPIPEPSGGEVLVKLECSGFCHSDVHSIYGETPMETNIAGHEGVGRVVKRRCNLQKIRNCYAEKIVLIKYMGQSAKMCQVC